MEVSMRALKGSSIHRNSSHCCTYENGNYNGDFDNPIPSNRVSWGGIWMKLSILWKEVARINA